MGILQSILSEIKTSDLTIQIRKICDDIMNEEKDKQKYSNIAPKGPNTFLVLECNGMNKNEVGFLSLEREVEEQYVIIYSTVNKNLTDAKIIRRKFWEVNENKAEKIITKYAKTFKFIRGE